MVISDNKRVALAGSGMKRNGYRGIIHVIRKEKMSTEIGDRIVNAGVADAEFIKIQTAEGLEEAARNLRSADVATMGDEVKHILHDVENTIQNFKVEIGADYKKIGDDYIRSSEQVHTLIVRHPVSSILVAGCIGVLIGMVAVKIKG